MKKQSKAPWNISYLQIFIFYVSTWCFLSKQRRNTARYDITLFFFFLIIDFYILQKQPVHAFPYFSSRNVYNRMKNGKKI